MSELARASAFEEALRERCATRVVPFRFGRALFNERFPAVWDLNMLRVDEPAGATVDALVAKADRLHAEAGNAHRRVTVLDDGAGARLEPGFVERGWKSDCFLFMGYRGGGERTADTSVVEEVVGRELRALREEIAGAEPWAEDETVLAMVLDSNELFWRAGNARHFAVRVDGAIASAADLYSDGRTAQVEDVVTGPAFRGRGLASAAVLRAVAEAHTTGHDFAFLIADDRDWPKELYVRLGFVPLGRKWSFLRQPA